MQDYERLGAFYLGRVYDARARAARDELLLYDAKDLTTHALCVGMTGSGKTGLCLALLEEAAIDGVPAIAIDPKGDLGNLLLAFPELRPEDFRPWIDAAEAGRQGLTADQLAEQTARRWREGLAASGQDPSRIARFRDAVDLALYTPGSRAGRPLALLRSLAAPPAALRHDEDALRDRVQAAAGGLLALLGLSADPVRSREQILLANLVDRAWREGRHLDLGSLIAEVQSPPFTRLGVMDLESFFPAKERFGLAMALNNLVASPSFGVWMEGEPLDVSALLSTPAGRPRISILSIAHLSDAERMFVVTQVLGEVVAWMRGQPGTPSLRAILYMDEIFGYFPPSASPPSKRPMLTLLKQARAVGLGVVLATQNPVDLDYRGLANAGTWLLGRLQTERDKERVIDGLQAATAGAGSAFDRAQIDRLLSGLPSRVFLLNNVHDREPVLFQTRWALSYLRGPLTREQIRTLTARDAAPAAAPPRAERPAPSSEKRERPLLPPDVPEAFMPCARPPEPGWRLLYRPALLGSARAHYVDARSGVDHWETEHWLAPLPHDEEPWEDAEALPGRPALAAEPAPDASYDELPAPAWRARSYAAWSRELGASVYRDGRLRLYRCPSLGRYSAPGQPEGDFRAQLLHAARERRDLAIEKLRQRYAPKLERLRERVQRAGERVERERVEQRDETVQTAVSLGATVLGALFGRRAASVGTASRASTTLRRAGRIAREQADVARAEAQRQELQEQLAALEAEFKLAIEPLGARLEPADLDVEPYELHPRKSDVEVLDTRLVWKPHYVGPDRSVRPAA